MLPSRNRSVPGVSENKKILLINYIETILFFSDNMKSYFGIFLRFAGKQYEITLLITILKNIYFILSEKNKMVSI
jgi:hypothetical protein